VLIFFSWAFESRCPWKLLRFEASSDCPSSDYEVQDQRNYRENEQQVNQGASHMEYREASNPRHQQHNEQYRPNAHFSLAFDARPPCTLQGAVKT
jgi:hypothetical protein